MSGKITTVIVSPIAAKHNKSERFSAKVTELGLRGLKDYSSVFACAHFLAIPLHSLRRREGSCLAVRSSWDRCRRRRLNPCQLHQQGTCTSAVQPAGH